QPGSKTVLRVTLTGPRHVPMQELFLEAGVMVVRLTHVGLGPLQLLDVRPGEWRELDRHEINSLRRADKG
ncbi:MAG: rRNA pseudouridine synthase, partial [bacterium]